MFSMHSQASSSPRLLVVCGFLYGPPARPGEIDWVSTLSLSVYLLIAALLVVATREDGVPLAAFVVLTAATIAIAFRTDAATGAVPVAALLAFAVMADWAVPQSLNHLIAPAGSRRARDRRPAAL